MVIGIIHPELKPVVQVEHFRQFAFHLAFTLEKSVPGPKAVRASSFVG